MQWIDPNGLPETTGILERFLPNPHGEVDGLLLTDGTEVHVPPHLSAPLLALLHPGRQVRVWGVRARDVSGFVAAVAVQGPAGERVVDDGPSAYEGSRRTARQAAEQAGSAADVAGTIRCLLHGPKGDSRGVLLEGGDVIRMTPDAAAAHKDLLSPGASLVARGQGLTMPIGTVIEAREIGTTTDALHPVKPKAPKHEGKAEKGHSGRHDPKHGGKHRHASEPLPAAP